MEYFDLMFLEDVCGQQAMEDPAESNPDDPTAGKYVFDYDKSFFKNLIAVIRMLNTRKRKE